MGNVSLVATVGGDYRDPNTSNPPGRTKGGVGEGEGQERPRGGWCGVASGQAAAPNKYGQRRAHIPFNW
eukprot:scaffold34976_cov112-Isochrysis_galbana.AAC.2